MAKRDDGLVKLAELEKARIMQKNFVELIGACNEVLRVSKKYSYLWDEDELWGEDNKGKLLYLCEGFIAQDESYSIYVKKEGNKFVFDGRNFSYGFKGLRGKGAALGMRGYGITAEWLRESFYESLKKPLGKYLANKQLEKIV